MNAAEFYIFKSQVGEDIHFWNIDNGWVDEFENATPFTGEILTLPLPQGASGVMPFSSASEPLAQFNTLPWSGYLNFFEKVY